MQVKEGKGSEAKQVRKGDDKKADEKKDWSAGEELRGEDGK